MRVYSVMSVQLFNVYIRVQLDIKFKCYESKNSFVFIKYPILYDNVSKIISIMHGITRSKLKEKQHEI